MIINMNNFLDAEVFLCSKPIIKAIVGFRLHQGIIVIAEKPKDYLLTDLDFPCLALNGLTDPENVGSIIRSCAAFNISSIIIDKNTASLR